MGMTLLESGHGHNKAQREVCCVCKSEAVKMGCVCRSEVVTAAQQLQAVLSGSGHEALSQAHLQQQLTEVEAQKQQSQADLTQAEQRLHQLQVRCS